MYFFYLKFFLEENNIIKINDVPTINENFFKCIITHISKNTTLNYLHNEQNFTNKKNEVYHTQI